jgi:2-polyprenyl-3-methyl-5-hydroxy-6-metoxy-1,4-benzoquinol methylase
MITVAPMGPLPAGNIYPKYETTNPIARALMERFTRALQELVRHSGARDIHEVGCGEGGLATLLARDGHRVRGSDVAPQAIERACARRDRLGLAIDFRCAGVFELDGERDSAELIVCCEVLEHLADPGEALTVLKALARPYLIASVPREPLWRALNMVRGAYLRDLGNTPGHLQHWSKRAFLELLAGYGEILAVRSPLPWTMALCRMR